MLVCETLSHNENCLSKMCHCASQFAKQHVIKIRLLSNQTWSSLSEKSYIYILIRLLFLVHAGNGNMGREIPDKWLC